MASMMGFAGEIEQQGEQVVHTNGIPHIGASWSTVSKAFWTSLNNCNRQ